jgi:hypothetical protein
MENDRFRGQAAPVEFYLFNLKNKQSRRANPAGLLAFLYLVFVSWIRT